MTTTNVKKSGWRSPKAEQKFREADAQRWRQAASVTPEAIEVPTSFGTTRAHHWPGDGPDIVLLHGLGDTSFRWVHYAESLSGNSACGSGAGGNSALGNNVYALDTMGEPGESVPEVAIESADQYGVWLAETLAGLGLSNAHIVGHSQGGFVALSYARQGGTAASYVLFEPVGMVELRIARFIAWGTFAAVGSYAPGPIRRFVAKRLRYPVMNDKVDFGTHLQAQRGHPMKPLPLPVITDDDLAAINTPIRLLAGAETSFFDVEAMARRVADLPKGSARLVSDAGHALTMSHFDECLAEIRAAVRI